MLFLAACSPLGDAPGPDRFARTSEVEEAFPGARATAEGTFELPTGDGSSVVIPYVVQEGLAVAGGDMILGEPSQLGLRGAAIDTDERRWTCEIPYEIASDLSATSRENFLGAVEHWEASTALRFVEDPSATDRIRVRNGSGCSAFVGRQGGQQNLTLRSTCTMGNAIHEIGHAVGLWHEQSRLDAPEHITVHWDRIRSGKEHNFRSWEQRGYVGIDVGAYDTGSLMQYGSWSFKNGGTCTERDTSGCTITTFDGGYIPAQRDGLSASDLRTVESIYAHCYGEVTPPVDQPTVLVWNERSEFDLDDGNTTTLTFTLEEDTELLIEASLGFFGQLDTVQFRRVDEAWDDAFAENTFSGSRMWNGWLAAGTYELSIQGAGMVSAWVGPARVHGYVEDPNDGDWQAVMSLVNQGDFDELDVAVGLDRRAAEAISEQVFGIYDLRDLDTLSYVGPSAFDSLFAYVRD